MWPVQEAMTDGQTDGRTDGRTPQVYRPQSEGLGPKNAKDLKIFFPVCNKADTREATQKWPGPKNGHIPRIQKLG